jgi:hypothetical protein
MIEEAKWLCSECGFDGVQWDYEFAPNGDERLLNLLSESRAALPPRKLISAATPMWYPMTLWGWNDDYYRKVAARCDQIAVMDYDSGFYLPHLYLWLLAQQCRHVTADATSGSHRCGVLFGLPTYDEGTRAHSNQPENIKLALKGMREGLGASASSPSYEGIALFAEYTTTPDEWKTYEDYWLHLLSPAAAPSCSWRV